MRSMETTRQQSCLECAERPNGLFCELPRESLQDFDGLKSLTVYPKGATLFEGGQPARRVFVLCQGKIKLFVSKSGRRMTLRIVRPGEVLGLSAALAGTAYETTAQSLGNAQVAMVKREDLLRFLHQHREACLQVVGLLSQDLHFAYDRMRYFGMPRSRRRHGLGEFPKALPPSTDQGPERFRNI